MVLDYYKLREQPFGVTPDPKYLYLGAAHREALASLLYGIEAERGFLALIAKPGLGKTTLLFRTMNQIEDKFRIVFLFQTIGTPVDLLRVVLFDMGVQDVPYNLIELQSKLNEVLVEQSRLGKPVIVVIDEAQNLGDAVLEQVRMLSNFETGRTKLIHIILSGQPQLAERLASRQFVQLRQRISILASLKPLSREETALYIRHRIGIAGASISTPVFRREASALIAEHSGGIPRNINNICFHALSLGYVLKRQTIDRDVIRDVIADLDLKLLQETASLDVRLEKGNEPESPLLPGEPVAIAASGRSTEAARLPKLTVTAAILLALAALLGGYRLTRLKAVARAKSVVQPIAPPSAPSVNVEQHPQRIAPPTLPTSIRVLPGQTLTGLCVENFGSCDPERLKEIQRLNPWLSDLDHIEGGQRVRIPAVQEPSGVQRNGEQAGNILTAEKGKQ